MDWLFEFPFKIPFDVTTIDDVVRGFSIKYDAIFSSIKESLNGMIYGVQLVLGFIPWWIYLLTVFFLGWKLGGKLKNGIIYSIILSLIGMMNLWGLMIETISIVVTSVIISVILGFPIGIAISRSERANRTVRPILDAMQTMPVFVYLIPVAIFLGLGKAPAVIATTIYAIVPLIRLTSHGIRQVDTEVVEAARAFGSTELQALYKVQIPQALPTIMTGLNQTLMMAMSMVVTCSMIGASGLGMEVLIGVNRMEIGRGVIAGTAVVIVAIILDRVTQGLVKKGEELDNNEQ